MLEPSEDPCVLWTADSWRCELWGTPESGWLVLVNGAEEVLRRPAHGMDELRQTAQEWFSRVSGDNTGFAVPEPSRRWLDQRRGAERGGRRAGDRGVGGGGQTGGEQA